MPVNKFARFKEFPQSYTDISITYHIRYSNQQTKFFSYFPETSENKDNFNTKLMLLNEFRDVDDVLDKCCQLAFGQPFPNNQLILMNDGCFQKATYTVLTESDPDQCIASTHKTYSPYSTWLQNISTLTKKCHFTPKKT